MKCRDCKFLDANIKSYVCNKREIDNIFPSDKACRKFEHRYIMNDDARSFKISTPKTYTIDLGRISELQDILVVFNVILSAFPITVTEGSEHFEKLKKYLKEV